MLLLEDKRFYVYIYLDPRKPGEYIYGEYNFNYEPLYIGKGCDQRKEFHLRYYKKINPRSNLVFLRKIKKILSLNKIPIIKIIKENLNEKDAYSLEFDIIKIIGRRILNNGPLLNISDGGVLKFSKERKKEIQRKSTESRMIIKSLMSEKEKEDARQRKSLKTLEQRKRMDPIKLKELDNKFIYNRKNKKTKEETKKKISESKKKYMQSLSPEERKQKFGHNKGHKMSEEQKEKISQTLKQNPKIITEETRKKLSEAGKRHKVTEQTREKLRQVHLNKKMSEETKRKISETKKRNFLKKKLGNNED